ncbi:Ubiquitin carboxyl-terminal hydrolase 16 [Saitoella coloradoensis]
MTEDLPEILISEVSSDESGNEGGKKCAHLKKGVRVPKVKRALAGFTSQKTGSPVCFSCAAADKNVGPPEGGAVLCLTCAVPFCTRTDAGHGVAHWEAAQHPLTINLNTGELWCYACDDNIKPNGTKNAVIAEVKAVVEKWARKMEEKSEERAIKETKTTAKKGKGSKKDEAGFKTRNPGLVNLGNTCYFNSVFQVMASLSPLHEFITTFPPPSSTGPLTAAFAALLDDFYNSKSTQSISPVGLMTQIGKKGGSTFRRLGDQQDAQELLRTLLEGMRTEEIKTWTHEERELAQKQPTGKTRPKRAFVDQVFGGTLASVVVCDTCKNVSTNFEDFGELSLGCKPASTPGMSKPPPVPSLGGGRASGFESAPEVELSKSAMEDREKRMRKRDRLKVAMRFSSRDRTTRRESNESAKSGGTDRSRLSMDDARPGLADAVSSADEDADHADEDAGLRGRLAGMSLGLGRSKSTSRRMSSTGVSPGPEQKKEEWGAYLRNLVSWGQQASATAGTPKMKKGKVSIWDCMEEFFQVEKLEGGNAYACEECGKIAAGAKKEVQQVEEAVEMRIEEEKMKAEAQNDAASDTSDESFVHVDVSPAPSSTNGSTLQSDITSPTTESSTTAPVPSPPSDAKEEKKEEKKPTVMRIAYKRFVIATPPKVLTLHLKRFQQVGRSMRKIDDFVEFETEIDLQPFIAPDSMDKTTSTEAVSTKYRLVGVVVHMGTMSGGHYISYQLNPRITLAEEAAKKAVTDAPSVEEKPKVWEHRRWCYASDTSVRAATEAEVLGAKAYLLFYERI